MFYLYGILLGVLCDAVVAPEEVEFIRQWRAEAVDDVSRSIYAKGDAFWGESEPTFLSAFHIWREVERAIGGDDSKRTQTNAAIWYLRGFVRGLAADATIDAKEWRRLNGGLKTYSPILGQDENFDAVLNGVQAIVDEKNVGSASDSDLAVRLAQTLDVWKGDESEAETPQE